MSDVHERLKRLRDEAAAAQPHDFETMHDCLCDALDIAWSGFSDLAAELADIRGRIASLEGRE